MSKKAIITGITGQDGSCLAEFLLFLGYEVHGLIRRASTFNTSSIGHIYIDPHDPNARPFLHYGDLTDADCYIRSSGCADVLYHNISITNGLWEETTGVLMTVLAAIALVVFKEQKILVRCNQWIPLKRRDISYSDPNMIASKLHPQIFLQSQTYSDIF